MAKKRASLDLDSSVGIEEVIEGYQEKSTPDFATIKEVAEQSGFVSRQPQKNRRRRKKSPFTDQLGIKVRPEMKALFQDIGERLSVYDHTTFECALLALLEKEGIKDLLKQYKEITK